MYLFGCNIDHLEFPFNWKRTTENLPYLYPSLSNLGHTVPQETRAIPSLSVRISQREHRIITSNIQYITEKSIGQGSFSNRKKSLRTLT